MLLYAWKKQGYTTRKTRVHFLPSVSRKHDALMDVTILLLSDVPVLLTFNCFDCFILSRHLHSDGDHEDGV
jgi:hypothetical protein